jgi:MEMO1 family protein
VAGPPQRGEDGGRPGPADYARSCIASFLGGGTAPAAPETPFFARRAACFVSLKKRGELRGCIGTLAPAEADLGREIARNAYSAAFHDPRFPALREDELATLSVSVDVLSVSEPCLPTELDPAVYGVIVSYGPRRGVLLPDLAGIDSVALQVSVALQKAGIAATDAFDVERFTVSRFHEGDPAEDGETTARGIRPDPCRPA